MAVVSAVASLLLLHEVYSATGAFNVPDIPAVVVSLAYVLPSQLYWLMLKFLVVAVTLLFICWALSLSNLAVSSTSRWQKF
jgi:hypothetical protein